MTTQEITDAIFYIAPGAEFSFKEADISTLQWDSTDIPQPTEEEIIAAIPLAKKAKADEEIAAKKAKAALLDKLGISEEELSLLI